jgi:hypothetical protein
MTDANGGVDLGTRRGQRRDVALSFGGAQWDYVEQAAQALQARRVRCFYDADEQTEPWGKYVGEELPAIYGEQWAVVVLQYEMPERRLLSLGRIWGWVW